jgi:hypothetical protein
MTDAFGQELRRLRATRIALRIGLVPLPFALALVLAEEARKAFVRRRDARRARGASTREPPETGRS